MIALLWKWIVGSFYQCRHEWETIDSGVTRTFENEGDSLPIYRTFKTLSKCKKCGDMKYRRIKL